MNWGLFGRVTVGISVVLAIALSLLGYLLLQELSVQKIQQRLNQTHLIAQALVENSRKELLRKSYSQLGQSFVVPEDEFIAYAFLADNNGKLIISSGVSINTSNFKPVKQIQTSISRIEEYQGELVRELIFPIKSGSLYLANLHIAYYQTVDMFSQGFVAQKIIFVLAAAWLLIVIVLLMTLRRTMKPLSLLTELITTTSFNNPDRKLNDELRAYKDEVGVLACAFDALVANLQKSYEELAERESHYRQLVETANVIPWELDLNTQRITYVGPQAVEILGYPQEDWYKENFWLEHVYHKDRHLAENFYRRVAAGKDVNEIEYRMLHASGNVVWIRDWVNYSLKKSRIPVLQGFIFDISEQVTSKEELTGYREHLENLVEERTSELMAANDELQTFAHSVSQDLRVPLRIIHGFSQAMMEDYGDVIDKEGNKNLSRICAASQGMAKMIDDLLVLSKVTRQEMNRKKIDISQLVQKSIDQIQKQYPQQNVDYTIQSGMEAFGDQQLLRIVIENLLNNAWKFTARVKQPRVNFSMQEVEGRSVYTISDNGAGFDMQYADKLFSPFKRLHNSDEFTGAGIGLALAQKIILRHGGEMWGEGAVQEGASFSFTLSGKLKGYSGSVKKPLSFPSVYHKLS